jgi:hypothetical protein
LGQPNTVLAQASEVRTDADDASLQDVLAAIEAERRGIERGDPDDRWAAILRMPDGQLAQTCAEVGILSTDPTRQGMQQALGDFLRDHNQGARLLECVRCGCSSRFRGGDRVCWCDPCAAGGCEYSVHDQHERPPDRCADPLMNTHEYEHPRPPMSLVTVQRDFLLSSALAWQVYRRAVPALRLHIGVS